MAGRGKARLHVPAAALTAALALACAQALADPLPLGRSADGHVTVEVSTPSGPLVLALDTGAQASALTGEAVARLALTPSASSHSALTALTGESRVQRYTLSGARLGGLDLPDVSPAALAQAPDSPGELDGFLGLDALAGRSWRIDLAERTLEALPQAACRAPSGHALPALEGSVNGRAALFIIDTGLTGSVGNPALGRLLPRLFFRPVPAEIIGADGTRLPVQMMRARQVRVGSVNQRNPYIAIAALPVFDALGLADRPALFAGTDLLDGSVITLDLTDGGVCIEISSP